uniref:Interleukin 18 receptor 1 n=1 Tax=Poecilia latipinna TaxID=48699 RepID=A0A3B3W3K1_9TELE
MSKLCLLKSQAKKKKFCTEAVPKFLLVKKLKTVYTRAGEMVVLHCPQKNDPNTNVLWTNQTRQEMNLTSIMSPQSADLNQMDVLLHGHSLVILRASLSHQGNYSCSVRNASRKFWFSLIVYEPQSTEYEERNRYSTTCYTQESCTLYCPTANIPTRDTPNITDRGITWHKEGETVSTPHDFPSAVESYGGIYKCIRSFLYNGQIYNMSFSVMLEIQKSEYGKPEIISPQQNDVFHIDLGEFLSVIECKAVAYSDYDVVFWLSENSFVDTDESLPVFYNFSRTKYIDEVNMTASLVFKDVSEEDLLKKYTCKLESDHQQSSFITISLAEKSTPGPSHVMLAVSSVCVVVLMAAIVVVYVKFKIDGVGEVNGVFSVCSDEKSYDAFLMCYKSVTDGGLSEEDRKCLANTLEDEFGYSICLYDRDVFPAIAEAVLDCIEQSRAVVLVPSFPDPEPGSAVLSAIHTSLVERKTRLIFINTEQTEASRSGSFPEALQLLSKAGNSVTWKGRPPSTSFWKQLRYHLPAPQQTPKMQLLSQEC